MKYILFLVIFLPANVLAQLNISDEGLESLGLWVKESEARKEQNSRDVDEILRRSAEEERFNKLYDLKKQEIQQNQDFQQQILNNIEDNRRERQAEEDNRQWERDNL